MPVSTGLFSPRIRFRRYRLDLMEANVVVKILDNDEDWADTSAFSSYNSKVLLDNPNILIGETLDESMNRDIIIVDNKTGSPAQFTGQAVSRRGSSFTFLTVDRQGSWQTRQLLHALKGRQVSFYLPSNNRDFDLVQDINSTDQTIDVTDVGYSQLVDGAQPRDIVRIVKTDGTKSNPLPITSSSSPSAGVDRLSFSPTAVGIDCTIAEVDRIEYIHKARWNSDKVRMIFEHASGNMRASIPTMEVLE
jgi:hypothetical protein